MADAVLRSTDETWNPTLDAIVALKDKPSTTLLTGVHSGRLPAVMMILRATPLAVESCAILTWNCDRYFTLFYFNFVTSVPIYIHSLLCVEVDVSVIFHI